MQIYDVIIIGAGPAGIACGISAKQAQLNYLILEKGYLVNSIYNFPNNMTFFSTSQNLEIGDTPFISHADKPTRREALEYYRRLASSYELNIQYQQELRSADREEEHYAIKTKDGSQFKCKYLVVATGYYDNPRLLGVKGEDLPKVKHYYDDAHPYIGRDVLVIGAANSACDVALETWQKGARVTMAVRESRLYKKVKYWILPNIQNRIEEGSIKAYFNTQVKEIKEDSVILNTPEGSIEIRNDYVLAMTGYKPDYSFLEKLGIEFDDTDAHKPKLDPETLESTRDGLYVAGVIVAGLNTSELFIENTRHHGDAIMKSISSKIKA